MTDKEREIQIIRAFNGSLSSRPNSGQANVAFASGAKQTDAFAVMQCCGSGRLISATFAKSRSPNVSVF
jgi:hypothetical protein